MKKIAFVFMAVVLVAGGMVAMVSSPCFAQDYDYEYPPPPADIYAQPWVGPDTPWVFYNGDWFLDGVLYYYFGAAYGWAPYYAYPPAYIVRPGDWYSQRWWGWYQGHPTYWHGFLRHYPYWRAHRQGERYNRSFYERHNRGQGAGWQRGFHGAAPGRGHNPQPQGPNRRPQHYQPQMRPGPQQHRQMPPQQHMPMRPGPQQQHRQMQPQQHMPMRPGPQQQHRQMQPQQHMQMRPQHPQMRGPQQQPRGGQGQKEQKKH